MGKNKTLIDYTKGVRQGDNMAPLFFLFLIQAMNESYKKAKNRGEQMEFCTHKNTASHPGHLLQQPNPTHTKGTPFCFDKSLFVDDTTYLFGMHEETLASCEKLRIHFQRFGLIMHFGQLNQDRLHKTQSKTEAMYFPVTKKTEAELQEVKADLIFGPDNQYYLPFMDTFKYLGCKIHEDLNDK